MANPEHLAILKRRRPEARLIPLNLDVHLFEWEGAHGAMPLKRLALAFTTDNAKFEEQFDRVVRAMTVGGAKPPPPEPKL